MYVEIQRTANDSAIRGDYEKVVNAERLSIDNEGIKIYLTLDGERISTSISSADSKENVVDIVTASSAQYRLTWLCRTHGKAEWKQAKAHASSFVNCMSLMAELEYLYRVFG